MRICMNICGNDVLDWKVDCDDYLPDAKGIRDGGGERNRIVNEGSQTELGSGKERIAVLPKDKYRVFSGVCSCEKSWSDTIAVTK